ncbi:hypothetical protein ACFOM8_02155 [Paracoccus angustae]|uniref:Uncharacterized protein n=1 Tax=Paracoccus angustae TaxID=1671480 RepID=A0ABV7U003_9RHOB
MMNNSEKAICAVCMFVGYVLPWTLLFVGAGIAWFADDSLWETVSAALIIVSLIVFLVLAFLAHLSNNREKPCH